MISADFLGQSLSVDPWFQGAGAAGAAGAMAPALGRRRGRPLGRLLGAGQVAGPTGWWRYTATMGGDYHEWHKMMCIYIYLYHHSGNYVFSWLQWVIYREWHWNYSWYFNYRYLEITLSRDSNCEFIRGNNVSKAVLFPIPHLTSFMGGTSHQDTHEDDYLLVTEPRLPRWVPYPCGGFEGFALSRGSTHLQRFQSLPGTT